jgi:hypothetical protein
MQALKAGALRPGILCEGQIKILHLTTQLFELWGKPAPVYGQERDHEPGKGGAQT